MGKIVYLGHYEADEKRHTSPAGVTLMNYIIGAVNEAGYNLTVISPAPLINVEEREREEAFINKKTKCIFLPTVKLNKSLGIFGRYMCADKRSKNLDMELDLTVNDGDTLIVYHSLTLLRAVQRIKRRKNIKLIIQVCEIYADVIGEEKIKKSELEFFTLADSYIFSSPMLEKQINTSHKPYVICLGKYSTEKELTQRKNDGVLHIVYAGTLDPRKGAGTAVEAAAHLSDKYHLHILGFGNKKQREDIINKIEETNRLSKAKITYDGCLKGEEYTRFIQGCHIGLSTQSPQAEFNLTSFPSKILVYLSNGLRVISVRLPAIELSSIGKAVYYYENSNPLCIAEAIMKVDITDSYDGKGLLNELHKNFIKDIKKLLN